MFVIKASGEKENFNAEKVRRTCLRAGASKELADEIVEEIKKKIYDGMHTKEILNIVLKLLKKVPAGAARYDLKRAIMRLGPTGFPFENFVAGILQDYGYKVKVGQIIMGQCATHEIDIVAKKGNKRYMVECKYHNASGIYTGLKTALYTHARLLDLNDKFDQGWLVCNTKCSSETIKYSRCVGLKILSWRYPPGEGLEKLIEQNKLYPITILRNVNKYEKGRLSQAKFMLVKDLLRFDMVELKKKTGLPGAKLKKIVEEATHFIAGPISYNG